MSFENDEEAVDRLLSSFQRMMREEEERRREEEKRLEEVKSWFVLDEKGFAYYTASNKFVPDTTTRKERIERAIPVKMKGQPAVFERAIKSFERRVLDVRKNGSCYEVDVEMSEGKCTVFLDFESRTFYSTCEEYRKACENNNKRDALCKHIIAALTQPEDVRFEIYEQAANRERLRRLSVLKDSWERGREELGFKANSVVDPMLASHWVYFFLKYLVVPLKMKAVEPAHELVKSR